MPVGMTIYVRPAMLCLLAICFLRHKLTGAVRVASIPGNIGIGLHRDNTVYIGTATDVQACLDAAFNADPSFEVFFFDSGTGSCGYGSRGGLIATFRRSSDEQPKYWARIDEHMKTSAATACLTEKDARYLLTLLMYKEQTCSGMGSLDTATGLCTPQEGWVYYSEYDAGYSKDGAAYLLTRDQALDYVNNYCDTEDAKKMIFGGTWYCYYPYSLNSSEQAQGPSLITGDYCAQLFGNTSHAVKITEQMEYGYLRQVFKDANVHLGVTLRSGTTYQWYDGTTATDLPWASGKPLGGSNTFVKITWSGSIAGVEDAEPPIERLVCKKPATYSAYDACSKFKTCA